MAMNFGETNPNDARLQDAIDALRQGKRAVAKDLLTRLLKTDQNNVDYWLWLSAAVDTHKERLYCLQTALQVDQNNMAAKRGLILMGALPPDETILPFPMDHPIPWDTKVTLAEDANKPRGIKAVLANPMLRVVGVVILVGVLITGIAIAIINSRPVKLSALPTIPAGGTPTFTPTVTSLASPSPVVRTPTPTFIGPTPLALLLPETYTPTPFYVNTPHPATESYRAGIRFFNQGDYANAALQFEQAIAIESTAADLYYILGESYRAQGDYHKAKDAYQRGIEANATFGPNFLGRARANGGLDPEADVLDDLNEAIRLDGSLFEAFVERGNYYLRVGDLKNALADFKAAQGLAPQSPLPYLGLAKTYLAMESPAQALEAAQRANQLDQTILEVYLVLGQAYLANDQLTEAIGALQTYTVYAAEDVDALAMLAGAYNASKDYDQALETANRALKLAPRSITANYEHGMAYFGKQDWDNAYKDLDYAFRLSDKKYFDAGMNSGKAKYFAGEKGDAYIIISGLEGLLETDAQRVEFYYYRALALDGIGESKAALRDWKALLALPAEAVPEEIRIEAENRVFAVESPTPSQTPSKTPKPSATPKPSKTPNVSATPTNTETPTETATP